MLMSLRLKIHKIRSLEGQEKPTDALLSGRSWFPEFCSHPVRHLGDCRPAIAEFPDEAAEGIEFDMHIGIFHARYKPSYQKVIAEFRHQHHDGSALPRLPRNTLYGCKFQ